MKPAERMYTAISGGTPDRVPVFPKIWVDLAANLTGTPLLDVVTDPLTALKVIADTGLMFGMDAVRQFHFPKREIAWRDGKVFEVDRQGCVMGEIDMQGGLITHLYDPESFILEDPFFMAFNRYRNADKPIVKNVQDVDRMVVPDKQFFEELGWGVQQRQIMQMIGNNIALTGNLESATLTFLVGMRGMETALLDLIEQPQLVHRVMEKGAEISIEMGKFNLDLGIKILRLCDSVGNMSVISPKHWRTYIFPHIKTICDELHSYDKGARIYCHICGNILPVAEDLVNTGLDCIGPLDPLGGFTPAEVRKRVGKGISLMGGVNTLTFVQGTPQEILTESQTCIEQAGENGGYILGSGCTVPRNTPKENLCALREAVDRYGKY